MEGLGEGTYAVEASRRDLSGVSIGGIETNRDDLLLVLPPPTGIAGRVTEESGPVRRFQIQTNLRWREGGTSGMNSGPGRPFDSADGAFELLGMREASYEVSVQAEGFLQETIPPVAVKGGEVRRDLEIRLRRGVVARGLAWDAASKAPVAGAKVTAIQPPFAGFPSHLIGTHSATSLDDGSFELRALRPGTLRFVGSKQGLPEGASEPVEGVDGQAVEGIVVRFPIAGAIEGTAAGEGGQALHPAFATATRREPDRPPTGPLEGFGQVSTDPSGAFRIESLAPGEYEVVVTPMPVAGESRESALARRLRALARVEEGKTTRVEFPVPPRGCRVTGRVLVGGKGVRNVGLTIRRPSGDRSNLGPPAQAITRQDGSYEIHRVPPGPARLEVAWEAEGTRTELPFTIEIPDAGEFVHDVALPAGVIEGRVTRALDGKGVAGANVWAAPPERERTTWFSSPTLNAETDLEGRFSISYVPPGEYALLVHPSTRSGMPNLALARRDAVRVEEGSRASVEISLTEGATLVVTVVDPAGAPIPGARVRLAGLVWNQETTDEAGVARLVGVPPGDAGVVVSHSEFAWAPAEARIAREGETVSVRVLMGQGTEIRVRLLDEKGEPFDRPAVSFSWPGPPGRYAVASISPEAATQADRAVAKIRLPPGPYTLRAFRTGYSERVLPVLVGEHSPQIIEVRLEPQPPR